MQKIVFLPLDERPCNYDYPDYIGRISGLTLSMPPMSLLGRFKKEADPDALWLWLKENIHGASHLVVSMDLLIYGGIVPSRLHHLSDSVCRERIGHLRELKETCPDLAIYAFQLITRAPARDGSGEEPDYYEDYGYRIFRYGVIRDKDRLGAAGPKELKEFQEIKEQVPKEYLEDFLKRREVNYQNHLYTMKLVEDHVIDYLVIPLDDCREYGYAPAERKQLSALMAEKNLLSKIYMYPGADEMGCTLLARAINSISGLEPQVYVDYSSERGRLQIPSYEDRSIGETVPYHLLAAGCGLAETSAEADFILAVNPPTPFSLRLEKELITEEVLLESERNFPAFLSRLRKYRKRGQDIALADCAIPNGADRALMQFLYEQDMLKELGAYAGWNTSSNTLGTAVAHMVSYYGAKKLGHLTKEGQAVSEEFRFCRYLEDWGYMAVVRRKVTEALKDMDPEIGFLDLKDKEPAVRERVFESLEQFRKKWLPEVDFSYEVSLPWNRMFEIRIQRKP